MQASVSSGRAGLAGQWPARGGEVPTKLAAAVEVKQGDTIDFVVDCRESSQADAFEWPVDLRLADAGGNELGHWNSAADFAGPTTPSLAAQVAYAWQLAFQRPITAEEFSLVSRSSPRGSPTCAARLMPTPCGRRWPTWPSSCFVPTNSYTSIEDGPRCG